MPHRTIALGVALHLLALALVATALQWLLADYGYHYRGVGYGAALPNITHTDVLPYGINVRLETEPELDQSLALIRDSGYRWIRQRFPWRDIEPQKGFYRWERWDHIVALARQHGLEVIAVLDHPPDWSRADNSLPNRPPDDFNDYGDFVAAFVRHYQGKISFIQIWDEPNAFPNWGNRPIDPEGYVKLLAVAYQRAHQVDTTIQVLAAGLSPNTEPGGRNMSDLLFLEEMYRSGAQGHFDILAAKPYGLWYTPEDRRIAPEITNFSRVVRLREIMEAWGDAAKPIWAVEFGWNALPADWQGRPSIWGAVSEEVQAIYTVRALERARDEWPWLGVMLLQGFLPRAAPEDPVYGFSVVDTQRRPRPVYDAVRKLAISPQYAPVGRHDGHSPYLSRVGGWKAREGQTVGESGERLVLPFWGTRVDMLLWKGSQPARVRATVDGRPANGLPQADSTGLLELQGGAARLLRVTLAAHLSDGPHTLELVVAEGELVWDTLLVIRQPRQLLYAAAIGPLLLAGPWLLWRLAVLMWLLPWQQAWHAFQQRSATLLARLGFSEEQEESVLLAMVGLGLAAYLLLPEPYWLLAALALAGAAWMQPNLGLVAVVLSLPFSQQANVLGPWVISPSEGLLLMTLGAWALRWLTGRRYRGVRWHGITATDGAIVALLLASFASTGFSERPREALRELRTVILEPVVFYYLVVDTTRGRHQALRLVHTLILAGVAASLLGIYQYLFTQDVITAEGVRRVRAAYGSPNNLGLFLDRVLPLVGCLALFGLSRYRGWLYAVAVLPIVAALVLTYSVGAWLAVFAAALFVAAMRGRRAVAGVVGVGVAVGALLLPLVRLERVVAHFRLAEESTSYLRLQLWWSAIHMVRDHPLFGVGPDNFLYQYRERYILPEAWREPNLSHPHNFVLDFWLRVGIAGLVAFGVLLVIFFRTGLRLYHELHDGKDKALVLGLMAGMVAALAHGVIDNSYFLTDLAVLFWLSLGLMERLRQGFSPVARPTDRCSAT